jgi:NAD(P)-dependent dehydrogenase (short-subunit alcohol dehydrogenase family)
MSNRTILRQLDVTDEVSILQLYESVKSETGKLDVLVNNAGINGSVSEGSTLWRIKDRIRGSAARKLVKALKPVLEKVGMIRKGERASDADLDMVRIIMETNLYGPWRMIQVFLPLLLESDDPRIINISSGMGELGSLDGEMPGYSLSKASLNALTIMFSRELGGKAVKVNAMCPGWVKTDMGGPNAPREVHQGADTAVWLAIAEGIPGGKFFRDRKEIPW